jgi:3-hydroxybutyryl-CoA dehydratase
LQDIQHEEPVNMLLGDTRALVKTITALDVGAYSLLSGDFNPLHTDSTYSKKSKFGRQIVQGNLIVGLFTGMIAKDFPGPGAVLISQEVRFRAPVYIGTELKLSLEVVKNVERAKISYLSAQCHANTILCLEGLFKVYKSGLD